MRLSLTLATCMISLTAAAAQGPVKLNRPQMQHLHRDAKAYIAMLEDPSRDAWQQPDRVVTALHLKAGESIADIGAGSGYFSFRLADRVGDRGKVYSVDINPAMILHMNRRIRELNLKNVVTILSTPDDPLLPRASVDRFFICDTWHHIEDQVQYLERIKATLKPGGQVIMIDFKKKELPVGPPLEMKMARQDLVRQMKSQGFHLAGEPRFLTYQYFLIFTLQ